MRRETRRRPASWVIGLAAAILLLATAAVLTRLDDGTDSAGSSPTSAEPAATGGRPESRAEQTDPGGDEGDPRPEGRGTHDGSGENGVAQSGSASSGPGGEAAAVEAAIQFASAPQEWLYLDDEAIRQEVAEVATAEAAPDLAAETVSQVRAAREELAHAAGPVWWLVHPLAWRVEAFSPGGIGDASVEVWAVSVLSAADVAMPQSEWFTVTVDLTWDGDRWRVAGSHENPGPTPMTGPGDQPWEPEAFDDALDGFTRLAEEARP